MFRNLTTLFRAPRKRRKPRRTMLYPQGKIHNLQQIYESLNKRYFEDKLDINITWSGSGKVAKTRVVFGSYCHEKKLIKVNRFMEAHNFPLYCIEYIIFHEMLHNHLPPIKGKNGRRSIHHKAFNTLEKKFEHYGLSTIFIKKWVNTLK